jgi:2-dehydropantoate 2-reductase
MRVLVIGAGAVGSFIGARLGLAGHDVWLVGRHGLAEAVRDRGLTLVEPEGPARNTRATAVASVADAFADGASFDLALLTVKAYDTSQAIAELRAAAGAPSLILTLQNGVGNEEALAAAFGPEHVLSGAIDTPVSVPRPGEVQVHRARYMIGLAALADREALAGVSAALAGAGFETRRFDDYRSLKWTKLLMNILANAQCAILGWTPAQVMADPVAAELEARAWQEAIAVMRASGIAPVALGGYPFPALFPLIARLPARVLAQGLRRFVSGGRGDKLPSLYLALEGGKPSEVDWLNGAVVRHGARAGIPTPANAALAGTLDGLTRGVITRDAFHNDPRALAALV